MKPLLNILIRTSERPRYFRRMLDSIESQGYKNYRLIISADTLPSAEYVREAGYEPVIVSKGLPDEVNNAPYNDYLNTLMNEITDGWVMFMDDDDLYSDPDVFSSVAERLNDERKILVWRMQWPTGRTIPEDKFWGMVPFSTSHIGMPCFAFHHSLSKRCSFDKRKGADYRFISRLTRNLDVEWMDRVCVKLTNCGNWGMVKDLEV